MRSFITIVLLLTLALPVYSDTAWVTNATIKSVDLH